jgi:hypothetical protein
MAKNRVFCTIMVGSRFAVITAMANLQETLEGCCSQMVDSLLESQFQSGSGRAPSTAASGR